MNGLVEAEYRKKPSVKNSHKFALGIGDFGYSIVSCTVATYIMTFGTMAVGVKGSLMGLAIAIGTFFDAASDPIIGYLSDNGRNKFFGKRHGWMLVGSILLTIVSIFIWAVPMQLSMFGKFVWFAVGLTLIRTFNTMYFTPAGAFSVEISDDYNERTNIQAIRSVFYIIGMILPIIAMGFFQNKYTVYDEAGKIIRGGQFSVQGYVDFSYIAAAVAMFCIVILFVMTYSHVPRIKAKQMKDDAQKNPKKFKDVLKDFFGVFKNKDMRSIILGYSVAMISATLIITLGFHVFTFTFKTTTTQMYMLMGAMLLMTVLGQPLWMILSKKTDKKTTMMVGLFICLFGVVLLFIMFLLRLPLNKFIATNSWGIIIMMPPLIIAGMGTGVLYSMPLALIGDVVAKNSKTDKSEKTGTYAGMMTFAYKTSQALTQLCAGIMLDVIGFKEGSDIQTEAVASSLGWFLCMGLIVAIIAGLIIFSQLKVDRGEITKILEEQSNA